MDRFTEKQAQVSLWRAEAAGRYPNLWSRIIAEWKTPGPEDRAWLMYSANYLLRTCNVRWAIDPVRLKHRLPTAPEMDVARDLSGLSFVLLTHNHADHLDLDLLRALRDLPIRWVVPEPLLPCVVDQAQLPAENIIVPRTMEPIHIQGIKILPFEGLHWEEPPQTDFEIFAGPLRGVPATAYLVEFGPKRWLFPGDTRTYNPSQLPSFGPVDGLFAHLWLGRSCALMDEPPLLEAFCRFWIGLQPQRLIVTHLEEFGRDAADFWDEEHFQRVLVRLREISPNTHTSSAYMGESISLSVPHVVRRSQECQSQVDSHNRCGKL